MPTYLRAEISLYMYHKLVRKIHFFQDKDPGFISYVIPKLQVMMLQRGDTVFSIYQLAEEVYFLMEGRVVFIAPSGILYRDYAQGSYFGEVEILLGKTRNCTVKVVENNTHLLIMNKAHFLSMLQDYPTIGAEVIDTAHRREFLHQLDTKRVLFDKPPSHRFHVPRSDTLTRLVSQPTLGLVSRPTGEKTKTELKKQKFRNMWQHLFTKTEEEEAQERAEGAIRSVFKVFKQRRRGSHLLTVAATAAPKVSSSSLKFVKKWLLKREKGPPLRPGSKWKVVQEHIQDLHKVAKRNSVIRIAPSPFRRKTIRKVDFLFNSAYEDLLTPVTPRQEGEKKALMFLKQHNIFLEWKVEHLRRQDAKLRELHYQLGRKASAVFEEGERRLGAGRGGSGP